MAENIERILDLPVSMGINILSIIISYACQDTNITIISIARTEYKKIPSTWVNRYIGEAIEMGVGLKDEWDYRRLLELLLESVIEFQSELEKYIHFGLAAANAEIREAVEDFQEILQDSRDID